MARAVVLEWVEEQDLDLAWVSELVPALGLVPESGLAPALVLALARELVASVSV